MFCELFWWQDMLKCCIASCTPQRLEEKRRQRHGQRIQAFAKRCMDAVRERMDEIEEEEMRKEQERKAVVSTAGSSLHHTCLADFC